MIVLVASAVAQSQPAKTTFSVNLGDKVIALPAPEGYEEATSQWQNVKTLIASSEPPESDLLAGYLQVSDCDSLRKGGPALYQNYAKIAVLRAARAYNFSPAEFTGLVEYFRQNDAKLLNPEGNKIKETLAQLDQALSKEYSKDVKIDLSNPKSLGEFDRRPNVYGQLLLMKGTVHVDAKEFEPLPVLTTLTLLHVKQRVVAIYAYRKYQSKADADSLTQFTTKWVNEILAAN